MQLSLGCCCGSGEKNCLGCVSNDGNDSIPSAWIFDIDSPLSYGMSSAGAITGEFDPPGFPYALAGFSYFSKSTYDYSWTFPDLSAFGSSTTLVKDDAPKVPDASYIDCIWASNDVSYYWWAERGWARDFCFAEQKGRIPEWFKLANYTNASPWYYNNQGHTTPPSFSPNRTRISQPTSTEASSLCGTNEFACSDLYSAWDCHRNWYGVYALLRVEEPAENQTKLVLELRWAPEFVNHQTRITWAINNTTFQRFGDYVELIGTGISILGDQLEVGGLEPNYSALAAEFVSASSLANVGAGLMATYSKIYKCRNEVNGNPIVLTLETESKMFPDATQTKLEALGVTAPETVTVTPVW